MRNRSRGARGGRGGVVQQRITGATSFDGSNYFSTASGIAGVDTGFWVAVLFMLNSTASSTTRYLGRTTSASAGWFLQTLTTHGSLRFLATAADTTQKIAPVYTVQASDYGKLMMAVGVHEGAANVVKLYVNRAQVGTSTACTGYTAPTATNRIGDTFSSGHIFGAAGGHGVPALADIQAYFDAVKSARQMVAMSGVTTGRVWRCDRASTLTDVVGGSATMTVTGALTTTRQPYAWGW